MFWRELLASYEEFYNIRCGKGPRRLQPGLGILFLARPMNHSSRVVAPTLGLLADLTKPTITLTNLIFLKFGFAGAEQLLHHKSC